MNMGVRLRVVLRQLLMSNAVLPAIDLIFWSGVLLKTPNPAAGKPDFGVFLL